MRKAKCAKCGDITVWIEEGKLITSKKPEYVLKNTEIKMKFMEDLRNFLKKFQDENGLSSDFWILASLELGNIIMFTDKLDEDFEKK